MIQIKSNFKKNLHCVLQQISCSWNVHFLLCCVINCWTCCCFFFFYCGFSYAFIKLFNCFFDVLFFSARRSCCSDCWTVAELDCCFSMVKAAPNEWLAHWLVPMSCSEVPLCTSHCISCISSVIRIKWFSSSDSVDNYVLGYITSDDSSLCLAFPNNGK